MQFRIRLIVGVCLLFAAAPPPLASAAPEVVSAKITQGFSVRIPARSWAKLSFEVRNPDDKAHAILVKVFPEGGMAAGLAAVFSETLSVPPRCRMVYESPILSEASESYLVEAYSDGMRLPSKTTEKILLSTAYGAKSQVVVLNDDPDVSLGAFNQLQPFKDITLPAFHSSGSFPMSWVELKDVDVVVVLRPDMRRMSTAQTRALRDYLVQGGTVVFANPRFVLEAASGPWADLLPVHPTHVRTADALPALSGWLKSELAAACPMDFLESSPTLDGVTFVEEFGSPALRWRRVGLGSSRVSAIPITESLMKSKESYQGLLQFLLSTQSFVPATSRVESFLDDTTGYSVPGVSTVWIIFGLLFSGLGLVFLVGLLTRRMAAAWMFSAVAALAAAAGVLTFARPASTASGAVISGLEFATAAGVSQSVGDGFYLGFCDKDTQAKTAAPSSRSTLAPPPADRSRMIGMISLGGGSKGSQKTTQKGGRAAPQFKDPLQIERRDGISKIDPLRIKSMSTRQFSGVFSVDSGLSSATARPVLSLGGGKAALLPWTQPPGAPDAFGILALPGAASSLEKSGGRWAESGGTGVFRGDKMEAGLVSCLDGAYKKPAPLVAMAGKTGADSLFLKTEGATSKCLRVELFPAELSCKSNPLLIPGSMVVVQAGDPGSRMIMEGNRIKQELEARGAEKYAVEFQVPPEFAQITPKRVELRFNYLNSSGNVVVEPALKCKGTLLQPLKTGVKGVFVFEGAGIQDALDRFTGKGVVELKVSLVRNDLGLEQKLRGNKWSTREFSVSVLGDLPAQMLPLAY